MHDIVDLERRGRPGVFVATVEFESGAAAQARALGGDPAVVYVPHPIQDRTDAEMTDIADAAVAAILDQLVVPIEEGPLSPSRTFPRRVPSPSGRGTG